MQLPDTKAARAWIAKAFSEADGSPSTKRILFGVAVIAAVLLSAVDLCIHRSLTSAAVELLKNTGLVTGGAYGAGRFAETREQ